MRSVSSVAPKAEAVTICLTKPSSLLTSNRPVMEKIVLTMWFFFMVNAVPSPYALFVETAASFSGVLGIDPVSHFSLGSAKP